MSTTPPGEEPLGAEGQVADLLALLRSEAPDSDVSLGRRVMRTARWQSSLRPPLRAVGVIAGALADGFRLLLGIGERPESRR